MTSPGQASSLEALSSACNVSSSNVSILERYNSLSTLSPKVHNGPVRIAIFLNGSDAQILTQQFVVSNGALVLIDGGGATIRWQSLSKRAFYVSGGACLCLVNTVLDGQKRGSAFHAADSSILRLHNVTVHSAVAHPESAAAFSSADVGKTVSIMGDKALVDGTVRNIYWNDAKHSNMQGTITSVEEEYLGKVKLADDQAFENGVFDISSADGQGGAVFLTSGALMDAVHTRFHRNVGHFVGGAISATTAGTRVICRVCQFEDNEIEELAGGAVALGYGAVMDAQHTSFKGNRAPYHYGGAVLVTQCSMCQFKGNTAKYGGAIYLEEGAAVYATATGFKGNRADKYGGSVYGTDRGTHLQCSRCEFEASESLRHGGAIYLEYGAAINVHATSFVRNAAKFKGGAVAVMTGSMVHATDGAFLQNSPDAFWGSGSLLQCHNCRFNTSHNGPMVIVAAGKLQLHGLILFASASAAVATAIKTEGPLITVVQITNAELRFADSAAVSLAGELQCSNSTVQLQLEGSRFQIETGSQIEWKVRGLRGLDASVWLLV